MSDVSWRKEKKPKEANNEDSKGEEPSKVESEIKQIKDANE
jgi:hypothetical protein